ncbi:ABC transporter permease/substrate-binding protein [Gordonibacter massiliensis (ex Traore et al. 2017)]|uniref:ABC transporter permease/substrate-binding protein n=1 Tax=Gordonibacter massiliensis (ex Traore et al. 2017) TaxID=1841863 RepID=UPI001FE44A14|nr:glycine betaine ABC transporter substrate-binding protein [Gordonibacter massiliensis (ex Traore et al. 2017)]
MFSLLVERRDWFFDLLLQHIGISLVSIVLAALIGLTLGIAIAQWRRGAKPVLALVNFVYTIPSIALFGFLIPVTGIGDLTAVVALTVYALLPMVRNTYTGLTTIEPAIVEAARGMGSTDRQLLYRIELPLAAPVIMNGIRSMATMTIALAGIASFIGAGGLGVAIYRGITTNNLAMTLAGSVLIAALAIAVDLLLGVAEKATRRYVEPKPRRSRARTAFGGILRPQHATLGATAGTPGRNDDSAGASVSDTALDAADVLLDDGEAGRMPEFQNADAAESRRAIAAALTPRRRGVTVIALVAALAIVVGGAFAFANRGGSGGDTVHIATKPMTEQYILGEMLNTLIEHDTDLNVELTQGVGGGTSNIEPGMERGDFDLYPEYTGTGWNAVLKHEDTYDESLFDAMQQEYESQLGLTWVGAYGFNNTYGLAVSKDVADRFDLRTYSDLARAAGELTLGAEPDFFDRQDGYPGLQQAYGMSFAATRDMDISLKYQALFEGQVNAIVVSTTDGQVADDRLVVLEDDKGFYPSYLCCNVVRMDTLEKHPELRDELLKLQGTISDADMARMNNAVETQGQEPKTVADAFLAEKGLI